MTFRPDPKPEPTPKRETAYGSTLPRREKPMPRGEKPLARTGPLSRSAATERKAPQRSQDPASKGKRTNYLNRTRKRSDAETLRIYGPPARRDMVTSMPCACCGRPATAGEPNQQAHLHTGTDRGTSRKASARFVVALCARCHLTGPQNHHAFGTDAAFELARGLAPGHLRRAADATEARWRERSRERGEA